MHSEGFLYTVDHLRVDLVFGVQVSVSAHWSVPSLNRYLRVLNQYPTVNPKNQKLFPPHHAHHVQPVEHTHNPAHTTALPNTRTPHLYALHAHLGAVYAPSV